MNWKHVAIIPVVCLTTLVCGVGCRGTGAVAPEMLGTKVDQAMQAQEMNAEAAKHMIYTHEFDWRDPENPEQSSGGWRLNSDGEDHVKQIAVNILNGGDFPVFLERSRTSVNPNTEYKYPVHLSDELDEVRRQVVVAALQALGVPDAEERVVVSPAFAEGYTATEASSAYQNGLRRNGFGASGGGGFGFGGIGFGGGGIR